MADYRDCPERTCHSKSLSRAYDGIAYPTFPSKCWMLMSTLHGGLLRSGRIALGNLKKILRLPDPAYTKCIFPQLTSKFYYSNLYQLMKWLLEPFTDPDPTRVTLIAGRPCAAFCSRCRSGSCSHSSAQRLRVVPSRLAATPRYGLMQAKAT